MASYTPLPCGHTAIHGAREPAICPACDTLAALTQQGETTPVSGDEVTQADRDAAADLHHWYNGEMTGAEALMREGSYDEDERVQSFRRHRLAALHPTDQEAIRREARYCKRCHNSGSVMLAGTVEQDECPDCHGEAARWSQCDDVERVAQAIYEEDDPWHKAWPWPNLDPEAQGGKASAERYRDIARAAIRALMSAPEKEVG